MTKKQLDPAVSRVFCLQVEAQGNMARRVLVVDDEPLVCDSIKRILALDQYEVETTTSAQEALAAFQPGKFSLVIIDYEMPDMKGDKLAAALKQSDSRQPILMITAYAETLRLAGTFPLSVDRVISKPFETQDFRQAVAQLIARG